MPTRAEMLAKLSPEERTRMELVLNAEASTFTTRDKLEESIKELEKGVPAYVASGQGADESNDMLEHNCRVAIALARAMIKELGETPSSGNVCITFHFLHTLWGIASLGGEQTALLMKALQRSYGNLQGHMMVQALSSVVEEVTNPKPQAN